VKDKNGKILEEKEAIRKRWKEYSEEFYNNQNPVDNTILTKLPETNQKGARRSFPTRRSGICSTKSGKEESTRH